LGTIDAGFKNEEKTVILKLGLLASWHAVAKIMTAAVTEVLFFMFLLLKACQYIALANEQPVLLDAVQPLNIV
jgi:hypothetical protein